MAVYRNPVSQINEVESEDFTRDVLHGLSASPKYLSSRYFYDKTGDELFRQIMNCEEYYLSRCEMEIFAQQTEHLAEVILATQPVFDIIELGAGDATKSSHLLEYFVKAGKKFTYYPVDISANVIEQLEEELPNRLKGIQVSGLKGDYFEMIRKCYQVSSQRKLILFLGSNIGNFNKADTEIFLKELNRHLLPGDLVLVGFDLVKEPAKILTAYNDKRGITKAFNLNLLHRINTELGADFDLQAYDHFPVYDPVTMACKSYLISKKEQCVHINGQKISFEKDEPVQMELSQKYTVPNTADLAFDAGFKILAHFFDSKGWFMDAIWEKI